jgi:hypothetical protein
MVCQPAPVLMQALPSVLSKISQPALFVRVTFSAVV